LHISQLKSYCRCCCSCWCCWCGCCHLAACVSTGYS